MAYTTINKSTDYFNTKLYTGNQATQTITGVGFQPDWTWIKNRSASEHHVLTDAVRGANKQLNTNRNNAQLTLTTQLTAFTSDGFSVGGGSEVNGNGNNMLSWNWKANGAGSSNTDGSTTSTVSANTTSGFSIVKYNGTGANATVGHGLGVAPKVIIVKNLESSYEWIIGHADLDTNGTGFSNNWYFNGFGTGARTQNATASWNSTSPTNSVFSLHSGATYMNASGEANIAYCFAEKKGFSKFGSYTGNGSTDGTFVYTGFSPAIIIAKKTSGTGDWIIWDNKRDGYNETLKRLYPNEPAAEENSTTQGVDFLSNGFKLRGTSSNAWNSGSDTYIYMAFAEEPLVSSNGVAAVAR